MFGLASSWGFAALQHWAMRETVVVAGFSILVMVAWWLGNEGL